MNSIIAIHQGSRPSGASSAEPSPRPLHLGEGEVKADRGMESPGGNKSARR